MSTRKTKLILGMAALVLIGAVVAVKIFFFPSLKDTYFVLNERSMRQAPMGIVVVRPTHFPKSVRKGISGMSVLVGGKQVQRFVGRNATFKEMMALAYGQNEQRVVVPWGEPKTNFDFLVTVKEKQQERLQDAIRKDLGFVAKMEERDSEVLALKVANSDLPGLTVSGNDERENVSFNDGKLEFRHMRLGMMAGGLEDVYKTAVVDKTGLTNAYNFSLAMDMQLQRQLADPASARPLVDKILAGWGLKLEKDISPMQVLVVSKSH